MSLKEASRSDPQVMIVSRSGTSQSMQGDDCVTLGPPGDVFFRSVRPKPPCVRCPHCNTRLPSGLGELFSTR
eukprot:1189629-Prorocentrum_minimum.AAC.3